MKKQGGHSRNVAIALFPDKTEKRTVRFYFAILKLHNLSKVFSLVILTVNIKDKARLPQSHAVGRLADCARSLRVVEDRLLAKVSRFWRKTETIIQFTLTDDSFEHANFAPRMPFNPLHFTRMVCLLSHVACIPLTIIHGRLS